MKKNKRGSGLGFGHRKMAVEQLEQRSMLAGNVSVSNVGGNLIIRGDNNDNAVLVQEIAPLPNTSGHSYAVTGFDFADSPVFLPGFQAGPTVIKGGIDVGGGTHLIGGIKYDINIDMKKGNDVLAVGNSVDDLLALAEGCGFGLGLGSGSASTPGSAAITAQEVATDKLTTPLNLIINMGDGNDGVAVIADVGTSGFLNGVGASLVINTGNGNDAVAVGNAQGLEIPFSEVSQESPGEISDATMLSLVITTGNGNDNVCATHFIAFGGVSVVTGNGNDEAHLTHFDAAAVTVNTGAGNDGSPSGDSPITIFDAEIFVDLNRNNTPDGNEPFGPLTVVTGSGNDLVDVDAVFAQSIVVDTGSGNDGNNSGEPIEIDNCTVVGNVVLSTGPGNDVAEVLNELEEIDQAAGDGIIHGSLIIDMGAGNDQLFLGGDDEFVDLIVLGSLIVNAGSGNDFVDLANGTISLITTFSMGQGNDELHIFQSGGGSAVATLIANGGPGTDTFRNQLGVNSNGNFGFDGNGVPHIIVRNFEFFESPDDLATVLASGKKSRGW